jgi:hypothetical protein
LCEAVFWMIEDGQLMQGPEKINHGLAAHIATFKDEKRKRGKNGNELFSFTSRGLTLPMPYPTPDRPSRWSAEAKSSAAVPAVAHRPPSPPPAPASSSPPPPPQVVVAPASSAVPAAVAAVAAPPVTSWVAPSLRDMRAQGLSMDVSNSLFVPDFSSTCIPYIRALPDTVFACLPIPAVEAVRDAFASESMQSVPSVEAVERKFDVDIFVPRMTGDEEGEVKDAEGWLNVTVKALDAEGRVMDDKVLDNALLCLMERCRRAVLAGSPN